MSDGGGAKASYDSSLKYLTFVPNIFIHVVAKYERRLEQHAIAKRCKCCNHGINLLQSLKSTLTL